MINKIVRVRHNANLSKLPSYKNGFVRGFVSVRDFVRKISEKQFIFNLFVTNCNDVKN